MPRNGTPSPCTRAASASTSSCSLERGERGAGRADAGEDRGARDRPTASGVPTSRHGEPEVLERVDDTRCVSRAVVDDVDHARPRVANRPNLSSSSSVSPMILAGCASCPLPSTRTSCSAVALARRSRSAAVPAVGRRTRARRGCRSSGVSRLTPSQLVAYYRAHAPASLPYRVPSASLEQLAQMFVDEGNRYYVRGDIAFAQSIVETGWFNFPDYGMVQPANNNFAGIGACDSCGERLPVRERAERCARADPAAPQLRRHRLAHRPHIPDPPVPELWGSTPATADVQLRPLLRQGSRAALEQHGQRQLGRLARLRAASCCASTTRCSSPAANPVSARPTSCSSAPLTEVGPCPVGLAPAGACHRGDAERRLLRAERRRHGAARTTAHPRSAHPTLRLRPRAATSR